MTQTIISHVFEDIPFEPDLPALFKRLRVREGSANAAELSRLIDQAYPLARPRGLLLEAYISERGEDWVEIEGIRFNSRVLRVNLEQAHRVFPYLATCGPELQQWAEDMARTCDDMLLSYWAEAIKESALFCAANALHDFLKTRIHPGKTAAMSPGSLTDWPIQQQQVLFSLFGSARERIGVQLTESMLMVPTKTISGIRYPTEVDFASCQLCPREGCPNRQAPYDPDLYNSKYCLHSG